MIPISTASACALSIGNKVFYQIIIKQYSKYKKQYEKDQQIIKSFNKLYKKSLQDNVIDENEFESLCNNSTDILMKIKTNLFYKHEYKNTIKLFSS